MRKMSDDAYDPRNVLILVKPEHAEIGRVMGAYLATQGMRSNMETDDLSSAVLLEVGKYDMLITGPGYDHVHDIVKKDATKAGVMTVAASTNGVQPDVKVENQIELLDYAAQGRLKEAYRQNVGIQAIRMNKDIADLEKTLRNPTSEGAANDDREVDPLADTIVLY